MVVAMTARSAVTQQQLRRMYATSDGTGQSTFQTTEPLAFTMSQNYLDQIALSYLSSLGVTSHSG